MRFPCNQQQGCTGQKKRSVDEGGGEEDTELEETIQSESLSIHSEPKMKDLYDMSAVDIDAQ